MVVIWIIIGVCSLVFVGYKGDFLFLIIVFVFF